MKNKFKPSLWGLFYISLIFSILGFIFGIIFSQGEITNVVASNWITAISTLAIAIFTVVLAIVAWKTAESWKEQKRPESTVHSLRAIRKYQNAIERAYDEVEAQLKSKKSNAECKDILKSFVSKIGDELINLEISLNEYIIFAPENKEMLLRKERILKDSFCILAYIYDNENHEKLSTFEKRIRKKESDEFNKPKYSGSLFLVRIPDEIILKYVLDFFVKTTFHTCYFMYNKISGRKVILGRVS